MIPNLNSYYKPIKNHCIHTYILFIFIFFNLKMSQPTEPHPNFRVISTSHPNPHPKVHSLWAFYCKSARMSVTPVHNGRRRQPGPSSEKYRHEKGALFEGCLSDDTPVVPLVSTSDDSASSCTFHTRLVQLLCPPHTFTPPRRVGMAQAVYSMIERRTLVVLAGVVLCCFLGFFFPTWAT